MTTVSLKLLVLKTPHEEKLRAYYAALGVKFVEEKHGDGPVHHAGKIGDAILEIYPLAADGGTADTTTRLGFTVEKLSEVIQELRAIGVQIVTEPKQSTWGLRAVARDPDGRAVELYEK